MKNDAPQRPPKVLTRPSNNEIDGAKPPAIVRKHTNSAGDGRRPPRLITQSHVVNSTSEPFNAKRDLVPGFHHQLVSSLAAVNVAPKAALESMTHVTLATLARNLNVLPADPVFASSSGAPRLLKNRAEDRVDAQRLAENLKANLQIHCSHNNTLPERVKEKLGARLNRADVDALFAGRILYPQREQLAVIATELQTTVDALLLGARAAGESEQPKASTKDAHRQALIDVLAGVNAGPRKGLETLDSETLLLLARQLKLEKAA